MYRYILCESCSQFDSLPLTSLTISSDVEPNGVRVRAITLKGDVIHRNGNMTGGSASRLASEEEDAFAQGAIERLRHRRAALQESVGDLEKAGGRGGAKGGRVRGRRGGGSVYEVELESTRAEIGTCESRLVAIESDLAVTTTKLDGVRKQLATVESALRKLRPSLQRIQSDVFTCVAAPRPSRGLVNAVVVVHGHLLDLGLRRARLCLGRPRAPPRCFRGAHLARLLHAELGREHRRRPSALGRPVWVSPRPKGKVQ